MSIDSSEAEERIKAVLNTATAVEFIEEPLSGVVGYLSRAHGINIRIDTRALEDVNMGTDTPVTASLEGVSLRAALRLILADLDLTYVIRDEVLMITTPEEAEMQLATTLYPVSDLVMFQDPSGETWADHDSLISLLTATIQPESWEEVGGPGSVGPMSLSGKEVLAIRQTEEAHDEIADMLARMRGMVEPRDGEELPVRERGETPPGPFGRMGGTGGFGAGGLGGMGGGFGAPPRQSTDLLRGLKATNRELQGQQVDKFDKMYEESGKGGRGAGFF